MLICEVNISNNVIALGTWFSMVVYISARFLFALIGENVSAHSTGSHKGIGGGIQIPAFFVLVFGFSKSLRKEREKINVVSVISSFDMERVLQNLLSTGELVERFFRITWVENASHYWFMGFALVYIGLKPLGNLMKFTQHIIHHGLGFPSSVDV